MLLGMLGFTSSAWAQAEFDLNRWQTWNNLTPNILVCAVEKKTGKTYPPYSCANAVEEQKKARVVPDPCKLKDYYAGAWSEGGLPIEVARLVHPDAADGSLSWNAGFLQGVTIHLKKRYTDEAEVFSKVPKPLPAKNEQTKLSFAPKCHREFSCITVEFHDFQDLSGFDCAK